MNDSLLQSLLIVDPGLADAFRPVGPYDTTAVPSAITPQVSSDTSLSSMLSDPGFYQSAGALLGGLGSLGNVALGFKGLGLLEDQLGLKREQWNESLAELNHLRDTRDRISTAYMA
jgi:hypothetical protein